MNTIQLAKWLTERQLDTKSKQVLVTYWDTQDELCTAGVNNIRETEFFIELDAVVDLGEKGGDRPDKDDWKERS